MSIFRRNLLMNIGGGATPPIIIDNPHDGEFMWIVNYNSEYRRMTRRLSNNYGANWYTGWGGETWTPASPPDTNGVFGVSEDGIHTVCTRGSWIYTSHDNGETWNGVNTSDGLWEYGNAPEGGDYAVIDKTGQNIVVAGPNAKLFVSNDGGASFVVNSQKADEKIKGIYLSKNNKLLIVVYDRYNYYVLVSDDFGKTMTEIPEMSNVYGLDQLGQRGCAGISQDGSIIVVMNHHVMTIYKDGKMQKIDIQYKGMSRAIGLQIQKDNKVVYVVFDNENYSPAYTYLSKYDLESQKWENNKFTSADINASNVIRYGSYHAVLSANAEHILITGKGVVCSVPGEPLKLAKVNGFDTHIGTCITMSK